MATRRRDERGVTAVLMAVMMSGVLLMSAAFAVDLGQQRVVRRDMQAIADVVALDLVRLLDGRTAAAYDKSAFDAAKNKSVARNDTALGGTLEESDVNWDFVVRDAADTKWDVIDKSSSIAPDAIKVTAKSDTAFAFGGVSGLARGGSTREAVASLEPFVCFSVGANLVDLDTSSNVLVQALQTFLGIDLLAVSLSAVGPDGIASLKQAKVPLLDLAAALDVGTVDALVSSPTPITVGQLLTASAEVLNNKGTLADANAALLLNALAAKANLATPTLLVSDILTLGPGGGSALNADLSVADLLEVLVYVAGDHAVGVTVPLAVPGVANMLTTVEIIEIPKVACARPNQTPAVEAESAQIRLTSTIDLGAATLVTNLLTELNNTLSALLGALLSTREERVKPGTLASTLTLSVTSAQAKAKLKNPGGLRCSDPAGQTASFDVTTSLANVDLALRLGYVVQRRTRTLPLLPWGPWTDIKTVSDTILGLGANLGDATPRDVDLVYPAPPDETMPFNSHDAALALTLAVTTSQQNGILAIVGSLLTPVMNTLVNPLVSSLNAGLLPALRTTLGTLGIKLGNTTLKASGRPGCSPRLVG
ncbi:hypothetical protein [Nocardioides sp. WS12]|uniref:hypothetical protein n=1 Tax=Nocardioides sp. WS12 TaxID=2486272 RepID=UPI0015F9CCFC|nr:hypothetical protein [Nocardioides sp. WS12]